MIIHLDKSRNRTVAQVREVLEGVYPLEFTAAADSDACSKWGAGVLRLRYWRLNRADRRPRSGRTGYRFIGLPNPRYRCVGRAPAVVRPPRDVQPIHPTIKARAIVRWATLRSLPPLCLPSDYTTEKRLSPEKAGKSLD